MTMDPFYNTRMQPLEAYQELLSQSREEALLGSCAALLDWDELTYMPEGGGDSRSEQRAYLAGLEHDRATDKRRGELLACVEGSELVRDVDSAEAVNVREMRRLYDRLVRLPRKLVEELVRATSRGQRQWALARKKCDFARFRPSLEKIIMLKRKEADCLNPTGDPYDTLMETYEPGARSQDLASLFQALRADLLPLLDALTETRCRPDLAILEREFPVAEQRLLARDAAEAVGFDFERGRLDTAVHPFSMSIGPGDCRITTRFEPSNFCDGFFATLHEVGHGLYEQGLDPAHSGTPMGEPASIAVHESQSRLWENCVGRGRAFWKFFFPRARKTFPQVLGDVAPEDFFAAINVVRRSLIRIQADEVTYNLHILIRFELERALILGDLKVADLPGAWNESYQKHLGILPANDAVGCLQDGHWSEGLIGYFPTYTLGNLFAAQLFARARADLGDLDGPFAKGKFAGLLGWLREHIHRHGSRFPAQRLIEQATGMPLDHRPLVASLREKYGELFGI
jgi:carboxypeptidase Taq